MGKPCEIHLHKKIRKVKASFREFLLWYFGPEKLSKSSIIRNCITVTVYFQLVWKIKMILCLLNNKNFSQLEPRKEKSSETKNYIWDCTKERIIFWERQNYRTDTDGWLPGLRRGKVLTTTGDGTILYLDCGAGYKLFICQNSLICTSRRVNFSVCKLAKNVVLKKIPPKPKVILS